MKNVASGTQKDALAVGVEILSLTVNMGFIVPMKLALLFHEIKCAQIVNSGFQGLIKPHPRHLPAGREGMMNESKYKIVCFKCGEDGPLVIAPHRNEEGGVVGLLYVCEDCHELIKGSVIAIRILPTDSQKACGSSPCAP